MKCLFGFVAPTAHPLREKSMAQTAASATVAGASEPVFNRFFERLRKNRGQALIEYILLLPMVFLLLVNVVNFGGFFYAFITVANAARAAADYAIMGGATVASSHIASVTASQITTQITNDIAGLPNNPSLSVNICQNNSGTVTTLSGTCSSIASDPEAASYVLTSIDVTYTYVPFIPLFSFPNLHINATLPATTIHRRAVMRSMQ
jgi:Flp pilus assembly protein TadG